MRTRLPEERPKEPPTGYKIAHLVLDADGGRAGFLGVSLGAAAPYRVLDEARCVYGRRHRAPHRRCDCGFHCVHERGTAEGLLVQAEHRRAVLLEVSVLGPYIRFERGFRYARQRVRTATVGPCPCGAGASVLADAGWGRDGRRALEAACGGCAGGRARWTLATFARLAGGGLRIVAAPGVDALGDAPGMPELAAEAALLQARLDWFQGQLGRLGEAMGGDEPGVR
ncbi:hypothetical protein GTY65_21000 [Streptomyces sp. SID8379]|uniref:hypothetical protein n=1 Tax=unclassified Streptomyces TaxID=2593676 RepID=UPI00035C89AC|nr:MULTISPECIES: hypothetical protein [unclassified Streptomyces]MYW66518.1 hypothetical protein [Streptomyces sp. SID8379]